MKKNIKSFIQLYIIYISTIIWGIICISYPTTGNLLILIAGSIFMMVFAVIKTKQMGGKS